MFRWALIVKKHFVEFQQPKEKENKASSQDKIKRGSDRGGPNGSHKRARQNGPCPPRPQHQPQENRGQANNVCTKCSCPHPPRLCYLETGACFNCEKWDTRLESVKSQIVVNDRGQDTNRQGAPARAFSMNKGMLMLLLSR